VSEPLPNRIPPMPNQAPRPQTRRAHNLLLQLTSSRWTVIVGLIAVAITASITMNATSSFCLARYTAAMNDEHRQALQTQRDQWENDPRGFTIFQSMEPKDLADSCGWTLTNLRSDPLIIQSFCIEGSWPCPIALHNPGIDWQPTQAIHLPLTLGIGESIGFLQYTPTDRTNSYCAPVKSIKVETSRGTFYFDSNGTPLQ